ncbi:hypothetical protein HAX54_010819 [Datura stramonium]|uniref:VQ domain-containing protein n=1 Tax=Datura stramonium TaxID=4076 RepID=A0ABS8RX52_DATST|nr:hypothetical protein [Datura stramonium]
MDSGNNSASLQSSSGGGGGGDEEYDSRACDSFSSAFDTQNSSMFDPFANYFNPISRPHPPPPPPPSHNYTAAASSLFNLDTDWSKTLRSDHNHPMLLPSSHKPSYTNNNSLSFGTGVSLPAEDGGANVSVTTTTTPGTTAAVVPPADQPITHPARNPKKRSRASRRAPTTVLTTDTTNFRAMVQEFTGIPAPPFTSSYFPPRTRFDIFSSAPNSSIRSHAPAPAPACNINPLNISQPPNYLRRPFPQKIQPPPFLSPSSSSSSSSSLMLSCLANNIASASSTTTSASTSTIDYQLSSELGLLKPQLPSREGVANSVTQSSNLFSTIQHNSILTSLLHSSQKYPLGSKDQQQFQMPSNSSQLKIGSVLEEYSMNSAQHGHLLSGLPNLISPEQAASSRNDNSIATNFHGDKVQETVTSRGGEGMVESWICSSD